MIDDNIIEELKNTPLLLLTIKDREVINYFNNLLPYSTGFEIECNTGDSYDVENFNIIPDIIEVNNDPCEQRYRIPNGIRGILCLYHIADQLRYNSSMNEGSGIHYHIDCQDCFSDIQKLINGFSNRENTNLKEYILEELDTWNYNGSYNIRNISISGHTWLRLNQLRTLEFRIGEMTFDYKLLLKRIIHCNTIIRRLKKSLGQSISEIGYIEPDINRILEYSKLVSSASSSSGRSRLLSMTKKLEVLNSQLSTPKIETPIETISTRQRTHRID